MTARWGNDVSQAKAETLIAQAGRENATSLDLSRLALDSVPESLRHLTALTTLDLSGNRLMELPEWLGRLPHLTSLNLMRNPAAVAESLGNLTGLKALNLCANRLGSVPDALRQFDRLETLDLSGNRLVSLPDWFSELTSLRELRLGETGLDTVPAPVRQLTALSSLSLFGNVLTSLPDWIGELTSLRRFSLEFNGLGSLPEPLRRLTALASLDLHGNVLGRLPDWLAELTDLTRLDVGRNALGVLPDWLGELTKLTALNVAHNGLGSLPESMRRLTSLYTLDLRHNEFESLPDWLGELPQLAKLYLVPNENLVTPPPEIVANGTEAVLAFLRAGRDGGTTRIWRSKLILVGQGRAGKSTLVAALDGRGFDKHRPSTEGLAVTALPLRYPNPDGDPALAGVSMKLAVWDFGGQEIYHATHQFFLTARSLFLVVWNPNQGYDNSRLRYWLDAVTARAPGAPILLVATHGAQRPADLPLNDLRERFPAIIGACTVDSETGAGIEELRAAITKLAATLPLMGSPWPATWAAGAAAIRELPQTHTTLSAVRALLESHQVAGTDQDEVLAALTGLGDVLHYPEEQSLADTVVLQPEWLNTRIARILDSKEVAARDGQLLWQDVDSEWADVDPALREHFLTMMDHYDISYRVHDQGTDTASVVTALLPWEKPDLSSIWPADYTGRQISLTYNPSFIPPGIPTWFITRTRRFAARHWRTGALLRDPVSGSLAQVEADLVNGTLRITARGESLDRFLPVLLSELQHSLGRYPGLTAQRRIQCPLPDSGQHPQHQYNYLHLLKALLRGNETITCPDTGDEVVIRPLLSGIHPNPEELAGLGGHARIDVLESALGIRLDRIEGQVVLARENTDVLRVAAAESVEVRCPSVFTVRTVRRGMARTHFELRVCCEAEGQWHEVVFPDSAAADATYDLRTLNDWAQAVAPRIQTVATTAKAVLPLFSLLLGGIAVPLHGATKREVLSVRTHLPKIPSHLAVLDDSHAPADLRDVSVPTSYASTDADFRELRALFTALDAARTGHRTLGGLSRAQTTSGKTVFLCPYHAAR